MDRPYTWWLRTRAHAHAHIHPACHTSDTYISRSPMFSFVRSDRISLKAIKDLICSRRGDAHTSPDFVVDDNNGETISVPRTLILNINYSVFGSLSSLSADTLAYGRTMSLLEPVQPPTSVGLLGRAAWPCIHTTTGAPHLRMCSGCIGCQ